MENCTSYNNGLRDADSNNIDMCRDEDTSVNYIKNTLSYNVLYLYYIIRLSLVINNIT